MPFNDKWFATAIVDGGQTADDTTWQVFGSVGYRFNQRWSTQVGYRYMQIEKDFGDNDVTIDLSGHRGFIRGHQKRDQGRRARGRVDT